MAIKENLKKGLMAQTEAEDLQTFEEATNREITKKKESRTAQLNVLIPPSVAENISLVAKGQKLSVNEIINRLLEEYIENHPKELTKGKKIREIENS